MSLRVLGLVGLKGSGKTTVLEAIKAEHDVVEIQLAKLLKDVCSQAFEVERSYFDDQRFKEVSFVKARKVKEQELRQILHSFELLTVENLKIASKHIGKELLSPRDIAQYVGSDILRELDDNIHIRMATKHMDKTKINIISDIRFHNEFDFFKNSVGSFYSIFIHRPEVTPVNLHLAPVSERFVHEVGGKCDGLIVNNRSREELEVAAIDHFHVFKKLTENNM